MESLALLVALLFLVVLSAGPAALGFLYFDQPLFAAVFGLVAISSGWHWFSNTTTTVRYVGALSLLLGGYVWGRLLGLITQ